MSPVVFEFTPALVAGESGQREVAGFRGNGSRRRGGPRAFLGNGDRHNRGTHMPSRGRGRPQGAGVAGWLLDLWPGPADGGGPPLKSPGPNRLGTPSRMSDDDDDDDR